jgi:hypothetical protein
LGRLILRTGMSRPLSCALHSPARLALPGGIWPPLVSPAVPSRTLQMLAVTTYSLPTCTRSAPPVPSCPLPVAPRVDGVLQALPALQAEHGLG